MPIKALNQANLSSQAYEQLRDGLIDGAFSPGERLVLQTLAARLGTSVTPVREACQRLVSEHALEVRSSRFLIVPPLNLARYLEIRKIRLELESLATREATHHVTPKAIATLRDLQDRFRTANNARRAVEAARLNRRWHFAVYQMSGLPILIGQIENLWVSMGPILKVYHEHAAADYVNADEHDVVASALDQGDGNAAAAALRRDIERGGEGILRYLETHLDAG